LLALLQKLLYITSVAFILLIAENAFAEFPLELIAHFHSDSVGGLLWRDAISPGDIDGDGYSDILVAEYGGGKRVHAFQGGNPPDTIPDMLIGNYGARYAWVPDINGDGVDDFVMRETWQDSVEVVDVWLGGVDFFLKSEPDLRLFNATDTFSAFGISLSSGDVNGDEQNDLIIAAVNSDIYPYDGRFYIYHGGDLLDTIVDEHIDFYDQGNGYNDFWLGLSPGDINGDGLADFVYSGMKGNYPSYVGVIFGSVPLHSTPDVVFWTVWKEDINFDNFGEFLYSVGDINRDGCADFVVTGQALWPCLYFGGAPFDTIPLILGDTSDTATWGDVVANIGDINHDGWDDIAVGHPSFNYAYGIVYIYYGYRGMDGEADLILSGTGAWPYVGREFGHSVGSAGDFDGDGVDDVVVTASDIYAIEYAYGNVYVYAGDPSLPTSAERPVDNEFLPTQFAVLRQNHPNPFNGSTTIEYSLVGQQHRKVELVIYSILGQRVRILKKCTENGGRYEISWDGKEDSGKAVSSGVYFYVLKVDGDVIGKKMLLLK